MDAQNPLQHFDANLIRQSAQNRWQDILSSLGMDGTFLSNHHGPCPFCGGNDRWRWDNQNGNGSGFCNQCDATGDGFHLAAKLIGMDDKQEFPSLLEKVAEIIGVPSTESTGFKKKNSNKKKVAWTPIIPVPDDAPPPLSKHFRFGTPSASWTYRNDEGETLGYVLRFDYKGKKENWPLTFCRSDTGRRGWQWKGLIAPRPLYNLDLLAKRPEAPVLVVEGEKSADAAAVIFPEYVATTSPFGSNSAAKTDWSPVAGRRVIIWPDHDVAGEKYANDVVRLAVQVHATIVQIVTIPETFPVGWDLADSPPDGLKQGNLQQLIDEAQPYQQEADIKEEHCYTRKEISQIIEEENDFEELTGPIAQIVAQSNLPPSHIHSLQKFIAKKTGVPVKSLKEDATLYDEVYADKDQRHLEAARETIKAFGSGNLLYAFNAIYRWKNSGVWKTTDDREIKQKIHDVAGSQDLTRNVVDSILDLVKTEIFRPGHQFDASQKSINVMNGELHRYQGSWKLQPHEREHYRTTQIPVSYDPTATAPRFEKFLEEIFDGDHDAAEKKRVVGELFGYSMLASCWLEVFALLIGAGANGKSVLLTILIALIGKENVAAVQPSQFDNRFQRAHLHGKLVNAVTEIAEGAELPDAQLKAIVSGELTTAEHKHKPPFDFSPISTCWFATNHIPHTRDFSDALFRRAIILQFNRKFEGKNKDVRLVEKLKAELPGILNIALKGAASILDRGAFTECPSSDEAKRQWRKESDQVAQFIDDCCELEPRVSTPSREIWNTYRSWAADAGIKRTLNRNNFSTRLCRLGVTRSRGHRGIRMFSGLRLKEELYHQLTDFG
jgi:P4 family phage/plasmid primase-like protien